MAIITDNANASGVVVFQGAGSGSLNSLAQQTWLLWIKRNEHATLGNAKRILGFDGGNLPVKCLITSGTAGNIGVRLHRNTTQTQYQYRGVLAGSDWVYLAVQIDRSGSAGNLIMLHTGSLSQPAVRMTPLNVTDGTGTVAQEANGNGVRILKTVFAADSISDVAVSHVVIVNGLLSSDEIRKYQFDMSNNHLGSMAPALNLNLNDPVNMPDLSGNKCYASGSGLVHFPGPNF